MNKYIERKIERLYKKGNRLLEELDSVVYEHAQHQQESETLDIGDSIMSAYEHALKAELYRINAKLYKLSEKHGIQCDMFDFETMDYSGLAVA